MPKSIRIMTCEILVLSNIRVARNPMKMAKDIIKKGSNKAAYFSKTIFIACIPFTRIGAIIRTVIAPQ